MNNGLAFRAYSRAPYPVQDAACSAYGWVKRRERYGPGFRAALEALEASQWADADAVKDYKDREVRRVVTEAARAVPFYRDLYRGRIAASDVRGVEDLHELPIVTKQDILAHDAPFRSTHRGGWASTSGTTGTAFSFPVDEQATRLRWAVWWRHRRSFDFDLDDWHVNATGKPLTGLAGDSRRPYRIAWPLRQLVVGMRDVTPGSIRRLAEAMDRFGTSVITGYPSVVADIAVSLARAAVEPIDRVHLVTLGAENTLAHQREAIARAFPRATITDQYGLSELCGNLSRFRDCVRLHEDYEVGHFEVLDDRENEAPPGSTGRLVGTGFVNEAFPFIRYVTGDLATGAAEPCPCGRSTASFVQVDGRSDDAVLTSDGRSVMRFDYIFKDTAAVDEAQVVQRQAGQVVLRLVVRDGIDREPLEQLLHDRVRLYIDESLSVAIEYVDRIPRNANGKFKAVVHES